ALVMTYSNGLANEDLKPFGEHTLFDLGDNSKQFTCAAALRLEQDGKLSLDDPVAKFIEGVPDKAKAITLRQLLCHTSGLSDRAEIAKPPDFSKRDELAAAVLGTTLAHEPGAQLEWSNRGYNVAAVVIEKASGVPFDDYMRDHIFLPAGMRETGFV